MNSYQMVLHRPVETTGISGKVTGAGVEAHYVAAKGAQLGLTRSWSRELAPHGDNR